MEIIIVIISASLSGYLSYKLTQHKEKQTYTKERYEKVIAPIFFMLEPYLYCSEINSDILSVISSICDLVLSNRLYISGKLLDCASYCRDELIKNNKITKDLFYSFCSIIIIEYDHCCKLLGIQKRTISYKHRYHQIHPDKTYVVNEVIKYFCYLCVFIVFFTLTLFIYQLISTILKLLL